MGSTTRSYFLPSHCIAVTRAVMFQLYPLKLQEPPEPKKFNGWWKRHAWRYADGSTFTLRNFNSLLPGFSLAAVAITTLIVFEQVDEAINGPREDEHHH